jgi:hypothetical protein
MTTPRTSWPVTPRPDVSVLAIAYDRIRLKGDTGLRLLQLDPHGDRRRDRTSTRCIGRRPEFRWGNPPAPRRARTSRSRPALKVGQGTDALLTRYFWLPMQVILHTSGALGMAVAIGSPSGMAIGMTKDPLAGLVTRRPGQRHLPAEAGPTGPHSCLQLRQVSSSSTGRLSSSYLQAEPSPWPSPKERWEPAPGGCWSRPGGHQPWPSPRGGWGSSLAVNAPGPRGARGCIVLDGSGSVPVRSAAPRPVHFPAREGRVPPT